MSVTHSNSKLPLDQDLAEQAKPGHGVPSQDPNPSAQHPIEPHRATEERQTAMAGGGAVAGAAAGAIIGTAVAGPVGVVVGGTVGAVAGAVAGALGAGDAKPDEAEPD